VAAVAITGWERLDPIIALLVAANIVATAVSLVRRFVGGLMDRALPLGDRARVEAVLRGFTNEDVQFHAVRTRAAGRRAFVSVHILVPDDWSVRRGHDMAEQVEAAICAKIEHATVHAAVRWLESLPITRERLRVGSPGFQPVDLPCGGAGVYGSSEIRQIAVFCRGFGPRDAARGPLDVGLEAWQPPSGPSRGMRLLLLARSGAAGLRLETRFVVIALRSCHRHAGASADAPRRLRYSAILARLPHLCI